MAAINKLTLAGNHFTPDARALLDSSRLSSLLPWLFVCVCVFANFLFFRTLALVSPCFLITRCGFNLITPGAQNAAPLAQSQQQTTCSTPGETQSLSIASVFALLSLVIVYVCVCWAEKQSRTAAGQKGAKSSSLALIETSGKCLPSI